MKSLFVIAAILVCSAYGDGVGNQLLKSLRICPIVDCAFMACLDGMSTHTQSFHFNGMNCPGCQTCARPIDIKRAIDPLKVGNIIKLDICPIPMCMALYNCPKEDQVQGYFHINGKKCPSCMLCTGNNLTPIKNPGEVIKLDICPMTLCAQFVGCSSEQAVMGYFNFNGKRCPGCLHCPKITV